MEIQYLNTDFEIESTEDLTRILKEFGDDVSVTYHGQMRNHNCAVFVITPAFLGADEAVNYFCDLVEQLPSEIRGLWDRCVSKIVDMGFESGELPRSFHTELRASTVRRVADTGCSIRITIYPRCKGEESS